MAKYCVIRTDLMAGTKNPDQLVSVRYYADEAVAEVESAQASHTEGTAVVTLNAPVSDEVLKKVVEDEGYTVL